MAGLYRTNAGCEARHGMELVAEENRKKEGYWVICGRRIRINVRMGMRRRDEAIGDLATLASGTRPAEKKTR